MSNENENNVQDGQFFGMEEELGAVEPEEHLHLEDIGNVKLEVTADLGNCPMLVRDVLELKRGSVLQLSKMAGEMADILVNGLPLAKGEVVVLGDTLHVRIAEIYGMGDLYE